MPLTAERKDFRWRLEGQYVTVEPDAFVKKCVEEGLEIIGPFGGYWYAERKLEDGSEMWRANASGRWIYQARRVATQANVAGGPIKLDVTPASGQSIRLISLAAVNSGTNGLVGLVYDEDNASSARLGVIGSAAGTTMFLPSQGAAATASNNTIHSLGLIIAAGEKLSVEQSGAGAQNDMLTVAVVLELLGNSTEPTWSVARSTNAGDVTLASSTIGSNVVTPLLEGV